MENRRHRGEICKVYAEVSRCAGFVFVMMLIYFSMLEKENRCVIGVRVIPETSWLQVSFSRQMTSSKCGCLCCPPPPAAK